VSGSVIFRMSAARETTLAERREKPIAGNPSIAALEDGFPSRALAISISGRE
jgi:hypothetical protein